MTPTTRFLLPLSMLLSLAACAVPHENADVLLVLPAEDGELDDPTEDLTTYGGTFSTIQAAIDAATSGQTVTVPSGTYFESLTMKDGVQVLGSGRGETYLVGTVTATAVDTELRRMTLYDPGYYSSGTQYGNNGIVATGGSIIVDDVSLFYFNRAISLASVTSATISEVVAAYNFYGMQVDASSNVLVANGLIVSNAAGGISSLGGSSGYYYHNTLVGNAFGGSANYLTGAISLGVGGTEVVGNNIITGNYYGLNCYSCSSTWEYNNVWGNTTDYVNDASQATRDMSIDPQFNDPANGNYGLATGSPMIDAGHATYGVNVDFAGQARPQGNGYDVGADEYTSSAFDLLITEVMANPSNETTGEFVEIYNAGVFDVDLSGFIITDGDDTDEIGAYDGGSTLLPAGGYAVVVDTDYLGEYGMPSSAVIVSIADSRIGNGMTTSDPITLFEPAAAAIAATFSFPSDPGDGNSLEMNDLETGDVTGNWRVSVCGLGSSPGEGNCFAPSGDPAGLIITEVMANPVNESDDEYVEVYNPTTLDIDLGGLVISDGDSNDTLTGFNGGSTLLGPGDHALILDPDYAYGYFLPNDIVLVTTGDRTIGNGISNGSDPVTLFLSDGTTAIDTYAAPMSTVDGASVEKVDYAAADSASNWESAASYCGRMRSPGRLNGAAGGVCDPIVINEVMANPLNEGTGEFIELYNAGTWDTVDLAGMVISDGSQLDVLTSYDGTDGADTLLAPGGYAVVLDSNYDNNYSLPTDTVLMTTGDANLGNGLSVNDEVELYESDGVSLIDSYIFTSNPGNGSSVERVAVGNALDEAANWVASGCASGSSPGQLNCVSSGDSGITDSTIDLIITEVMANPLDERTGEYVEIYNNHGTAVDLLYGVIWDGDALDTILGFVDPLSATLQPGEYALIIDADYTGDYSDIPSDVLLLTTDDTTIGSGLAATNDPIYFFEGDASTLIDSYTHPFNPGNGTSVERVDMAVGDEASNWAASGCTRTPGYANCQP